MGQVPMGAMMSPTAAANTARYANAEADDEWSNQDKR